MAFANEIKKKNKAEKPIRNSRTWKCGKAAMFKERHKKNRGYFCLGVHFYRMPVL